MSKTNRPTTSRFRKVAETLIGVVVVVAIIGLGALLVSGQLAKLPLFWQSEGTKGLTPNPSLSGSLTSGLSSATASITPAATCPAQSSSGGKIAGAGIDSPFGLNIHANSRYARRGFLQIPLDSAKGTGVAWDREEIRWELVQRGNGQLFDFSLVDEMVDKAQGRGINVLGLLLYKVNNTVPDLPTWNKFVSSTVSHFKGRVECWQILNEPENNIFFAGTNPADYARVLKASYQTIKGVDPEAKVLTAGVNGFAVPWLQRMLDAGGAGNYDILAVHPYVSFPTSPEAKYWADNQLAYFMAFNRRNGNKPVWATEFGWPTVHNPATVSESDQANYLARLYVTGLAGGLDKLFVYQFHDQGPNSDDNFGLVRSDWTTPKPSYQAYKNLVERLSGATFQAKLDPLSSTNQPIADFENGPTNWKAFTEDATSAKLTASGEQKHGGTQALKVEYGLNGEGYIELGPPSPVVLQGQPTRIGFWVYGDDTGATFRVLVQGSDGQLFAYEPGKAGAKNWHRLEAYLPGEYVNRGQTGGDGVLRYPIRFKSIQMLRQPDPQETTWNSALYLDDFYAGEGANVQLYRFEKAGSNLDVVWAEGGPQNISLPTQSALNEVQAYNREGGPATFEVKDNTLILEAGQEMLFIEHKAA